MTELENIEMSEGGNSWRETVRDIYDRLHFKEPGFFSGDPLARELIAFIEIRHPDFFTKEAPHGCNHDRA